MLVLILIMSLFSSSYTKPSSIMDAKVKLFDIGKKKIEDFNQASSSGQIKKSLNILDSLYEMKIVLTPRELYSMCKKLVGADCTTFKARVMEDDGNAGSAMDLYLRSGRSIDYARLKIMSGEVVPVAEIPSIQKDYYFGLLAFVKGDWEKAIGFFSKKNLQNNRDAQFKLFYSFLVLGKYDSARAVFETASFSEDIYSYVDSKKMEAFLLYAENRQYEALDILKELLKFDPTDKISMRYIAHIYYRTGWYSIAEKIYQELISSEWRDTELYYLLSERCEMRVRYLKINLASKDADRIIKEYNNRPDFVVQWASWLLEYGYLEKASSYIDRLQNTDDNYSKALKFFALGLLEENSFKEDKALDLYKKAYELFPVNEYKQKIINIQGAQSIKGRNPEPVINCKEYNVNPASNGWFFVESGVLKYYLKKKGDKFEALLKMNFKYSDKISFGNRASRWSNEISSTWSSQNVTLSVLVTDKISRDSITVDVVPWPSSFYLKRASSHEWSVLTPYNVISHEAGHLFGLVDEYYELDPRIQSRNLKRYIGEPGSIMRNMLYGVPQKRHIQFMLSSLQCIK